MEKRFLPKMYCKSIYKIPYQKLKEQGIHYLIFDLDNTIGKIDEGLPSIETKELFKKLKQEFTVIIISNNFEKRVSCYVDQLVEFHLSFAMKPSCRGLRKIVEKFHCKKEEMVMIGDQLVTDIWSGNRFLIFTILVDPLAKKDLKVTGINRFLERRIFKKYQKLGLLERGKYYE